MILKKLFKLHIQTAEFHKDKIERRGGVEQMTVDYQCLMQVDYMH